jgi:hypothetical protein
MARSGGVSTKEKSAFLSINFFFAYKILFFHVYCFFVYLDDVSNCQSLIICGKSEVLRSIKIK